MQVLMCVFPKLLYMYMGVAYMEVHFIVWKVQYHIDIDKCLKNRNYVLTNSLKLSYLSYAVVQ